MTGEETHAEPRWADLSGFVLEGGYELEDLLEADQDRAKFKVRVLGDRTLDAFAHILRSVTEGAEDQLALWDAVRKLSHRNLNTPLASGKAESDGAGLLYAVLRKPEERLSVALRERALSPNEAGEVLTSVSGALQHLFENGLIHG